MNFVYDDTYSIMASDDPTFYPSTWDNIGLCIAQLSFARTCNMFRTLQYT